MDLSQITPLVLTYNEQANIGDTLSRLSWAERVVVVDSYSDDGTKEIAERFKNVDVVQRSFDNHTSQWNFGLDQIDADWVLTLDADYKVEHDLVQELEMLPETSESAYAANFEYRIFGRPLRRTIYPARNVLFRVAQGKYVEDGHTQLLDVPAQVTMLRSVIGHDDRKSLGRWVASQYRYAALEADKLLDSGNEQLRLQDRIRRWIFFAPPLTFAYCLVRHGLILDGWPGVYYSMQRTFAEMCLSLELLDRRCRRDNESSALPSGGKSVRTTTGDE